MKWYEVRVSTTDEASDAVSEMLTTMGAGGVAIKDPFDIKKEILKPNSLDYADDEFLESLGEDVVIQAYFQSGNDIDKLLKQINEGLVNISQFLNIGKGLEGYNEVDDEDWSTAWKKYYKPLQLTDRIVIKPTWEDYSPNADEIVIQMDPGMAFGTGTHETTQMCSILLDKYMKDDTEVLDIGCGTGILSIIAAKLGAKQVEAIDIDEVAVKVARENIELNQEITKVSARKAVLSDLKAEEHKYDIIVANIIANVIIDLSSQIPYYLKKESLFITSGIIKERKQEVIDACEKNGMSRIETLEMGEWVAMVFKCPDTL
ncbi:50S ribosomal protein L11 methyltransferase [Ruminiclostridium cellulolyticum]|uniref:Ribosomal protein L11 methyltransferase n=1 Tax=Ruminiclostridium cellulolyticum (strain ATCC 35319 / DSM 5812 / JCM 6584 / H10) TaxID=394503 RepID=PRMA_RUMCH|nr:50S ribosomal protein L11 methyltransferase [Ruminiclostridium cellulolyticum]B8I303.1 RecName: Full=Ribosomal protein L11 methyltransferase; Short=L11 Mtase [Ruminiclostridium cellulolyticum H10]ACL76146.1 ribosomal protein L11 methyltransferase [Ruminiclostridium cellulolyticum H10]